LPLRTLLAMTETTWSLPGMGRRLIAGLVQSAKRNRCAFAVGVVAQ